MTSGGETLQTMPTPAVAWKDDGLLLPVRDWLIDQLNVI